MHKNAKAGLMSRPLMTTSHLFTRTFAAALVCATVLLCAPLASAQPMMPAGGGAHDTLKGLGPDKVLSTVGVDQKLDTQLPPGLTFKDETGKSVQLSDYLGKRPLLLSLVYYECPGLCTQTLNGIARSLKPLKFTPGKEFDILTVSYDPREGPELAAAKKERYVKMYGKPEAAGGWHFLTGDDANTKAICEAVGFRYAYDEMTKQYAHAAAIMVVTPQGKISRYFYGLEYSTRDLEFGLMEASNERIGSLADGAVLYCYTYNPASGKYSLSIMRVLRVAAVLTLVLLGGSILLMLRRDKDKVRADADAVAAALAAEQGRKPPTPPDGALNPH
jgi:protein SCO1/2